MSIDSEHDQDDVKLPAMDSEISGLLRYASRLRWDDVAYLLGALHWHSAGEAVNIDESNAAALTAAHERADELLQLWRAWMDRYAELRAKRVTRWYESDELPLGTRLRERFAFLTTQFAKIADELEYTEAISPEEQRTAKDHVAAMQDAIHQLASWIGESEQRINMNDAKEEHTQ